MIYEPHDTKLSTTRLYKNIRIGISLQDVTWRSLFYLLKIINQQKELAEIKNDLISNITHEFKTPITTVSTALEAINSFNAIDDKEKTKKYIYANRLPWLHTTDTGFIGYVSYIYEDQAISLPMAYGRKETAAFHNSAV